MFIRKLLEKNHKFVETAIKFHGLGKIEPNSYILDVDNIVKNAKLIKKEADNYDINLYFMTKQIGRNPVIAKKIVEAGIEKAVAVDPWEAIRLHSNGIKIGNVGHIVQIPTNMIDSIIDVKPEVITVFSIEKIFEVNAAALKKKYIQNIILRIATDDSLFYEAQAGGIKISEIEKIIPKILELPNINLVGLTAFPCFVFDYETKTVKKTNNVDNILKAKKIIEGQFGLKMTHINMPSLNSYQNMKMASELGATYCEPGHSITGTTPAHKYFDLPEVPSILYVSEISHFFNEKAYIYGGGNYRRSMMNNILIVNAKNNEYNFYKANKISPEVIDYYFDFDCKNSSIKIGDTAIMCFRTQIFTTRSKVVLIEGISDNNPEIIGTFDSLGGRI